MAHITQDKGSGIRNQNAPRHDGENEQAGSPALSDERMVEVSAARSLAFQVVTGDPSHASEVKAIVYSVLRSFGIEPDPLRWEAEIESFGQNSTEFKEYVAIANGKVIGVGVFEIKDDGLAFFRDLYVDPQSRGFGVGRALMDHRLREARACGCTHGMLETRSEFKAAIQLFESTGWRRGPDLRGADDPSIGPDRTYLHDLTVCFQSDITLLEAQNGSNPRST